MVCESWKLKLDRYLDGELSEEEMRNFDSHVRNCPSCSADALARLQMKRGIQAVGKRFSPSPDFRKQILRKIASKPQNNFRMGWVFAVATLALLLVGGLASNYVTARSSREHVFSEIADLHVATLASATPVDVVSTDRHTVKPWFQGRIPFAFNLPELQNSEFTLIGGRMTYLDQAPGAHLIYDYRKHHISVLIFQERTLPASLEGTSSSPREVPFNMETWSSGGLRYFVVGDTSAAEIGGLAKLFKVE